MDCNKCKKNLKKCECPDIDERMADLKNNPNFIYKMCDTCGKHYERCKCDTPNWTTSHDGVSLEEALNAPTLEDKIGASGKDGANRGAELVNLFRTGKLSEEANRNLPENMPEELKMALTLLDKIGIKIKVLKADSNGNIVGEIGDLLKKENFEDKADDFDMIHLDSYIKSGGKLN